MKIKEYLSAIGKKGGKKKSKAKANAARENGKKGGRPKSAPPESERRGTQSSRASASPKDRN